MPSLVFCKAESRAANGRGGMPLRGPVRTGPAGAGTAARGGPDARWSARPGPTDIHQKTDTQTRFFADVRNKQRQCIAPFHTAKTN